MQAFVPSAPLPCHRAASQWSPPVCSARPPQSSRRPLPARILGAIAGALALVIVPGTRVDAAAKTSTPASNTTNKALRYDGRQELDKGEKAMSLGLTAGAFAALAVWAYKENRKDDELENIRIREEVERLEKLKAEFVDVEEEEEGGLDDEDLFASLKQRIGEEEGSAGEEGEEGEDKGGVVVEGDASSDVAPDSVDMLKRMWEATDDNKGQDKDKS
eukprot:GFKZ01011999.1.p2 GENE.GFKZ01011999.1~~GFKZ01011999.1.p2  ORF type:complete len:217 (+),score=51.21 GFKZ01011999.1:123-773(+)